MKNSVACGTATFQGLKNHLRVVATMLDRADMEYLHHHQKFFWTVWVSTSVSQIRRAQESPGIHRVKCRFRLRRSALEPETLHFYLLPAWTTL